MHVVFYDGHCGFCDGCVQFLLKADKKGKFLFAPLQGITAEKKLKNQIQSVDSLFLIENYQQPNEKLYIYGKAVFRIFWLLGGLWKLLGWIFFLPSFLYNWIYWLVAKYRRRKVFCILPDPRKRNKFLP